MGRTASLPAPQTTGACTTAEAVPQTAVAQHAFVSDDTDILDEIESCNEEAAVTPAALRP